MATYQELTEGKSKLWIVKRAMVQKGQLEIFGCTGKYRLKYFEQKFKKLITLIKKNGYAVTFHGMDRLNERTEFSFYEARNDMINHLDSLRYIVEHKRFYINGKKVRYVFSEDLALISVVPHKYPIMVYNENSIDLQSYISSIVSVGYTYT